MTRLQRVTTYLLAHRWQALIITLCTASLYAVPGLGLVAGLGALYAALVTLEQGPLEGLLFILAASAPAFLMGFHQHALMSLLPHTLSGIIIWSNIFTWVFAMMLYKKASWSQVLQVEALLAIFIVSVIHLLYPEIVNWWLPQISQALTEFQKHMAQVGWDKYLNSPEELQTLSMQSAQTATGMTLTMVMIINLLQLLIARWWQVKVFRPGTLAKELLTIRLNSLAGVAFVASWFLIYLNNSVALDTMPILLTLFCLAGLSLVHYFFSLMPPTPTNKFWLVLIYVVIIYSFAVSIFLLSTLALCDIGLDLRKRFKKV